MSKKTLLAFGIFIIVFGLLGVPFTRWGLVDDDFGNIFYSQLKSCKCFSKFFYQDTRVCLWPSNYDFGQASFFSVYYRPLIFVFYYLQSLVFGISPYGFYLVTVGLHALNAVLLFNIIFKISTCWVAFLAAMFFAFHSSLLNWFVWISAQQQQISLFFILLIFIFLKKYLDTNKLFYYLFALILFALALFTRETVLILPVLIFYFVCLCKKVESKQPFMSKILCSLRIVAAFMAVNLFYLCLRLYLFPIRFAGNGFNIYDVLTNIKNRWYEFICIATDALDLTLFPPGHFYLKGAIFLGILGFLFWAFFYNTKKKCIIFFLTSFLFLLWSVVFTSYVSRYLYEALPFFILAVVFCFQFCAKKIPKFFKICGISILSFLIVLNFCFLIFFLKSKENHLFAIQKAYDDLVYANKLDGRPVLFVGIPIILVNNVAPAIWLRDEKIDRPIYCDLATGSCTSSSVLTWFKRFYSILENFDENLVHVVCDKNVFHIKTLDSKKVFFGYGEVCEKQTSMGKIIIDKVDEEGRECELIFIVNHKWLQKNPLFVTWDYVNQKFIIFN